MTTPTNYLNEGWGEVKGTLLQGVSGHTKQVLETVLENTRSQILTETAASGSISAADIANFRKTLLPVIRRVIPGTIANELVSVQPMAGPVSQIFSMRYKYEESVTIDPTMSQYGGYDITAGDEAFGNASPIRQFYSSNTGVAQAPGASGFGWPGADGTSAPSDITGSPATGEGWDSDPNVTQYDTGTTLYGDPVGGTLYGGNGSLLEGSGGRKMSLQIISQAVEAKPRKLQASWTIEAMQDMNSQHGMDLETEMTKVLSAEIVQEIDAEIINDLLALAGTVRSFDLANTSGPTYTPTFIGDRFANLGAVIGEVSNEIARKTRLGQGNFLVVSPMVVTLLQTAGKSVFAPAIEGTFKSPTNTQLAGTLNGNIKVYSYLWDQAVSGNSAPAGTDKILVGYKGPQSNFYAGYVYAPYIPLMSTGTIMNPVTFQPVVSLLTRYAKAVFTDTTTSLGNSADYYGKINLANITFT
jgi:hypothetical protein